MPSKRRTLKLADQTITATLVLPEAEATFKLGEDGKGPPTFSALAYKGAEPVPGGTATPRLDAPYILDRAGMTLGESAAANFNHKSDQLVGHLTSAKNEADGIHVDGVLSIEGPEQQRIASGARNGFPWQVSIEATMSGIKKIPKGQTATVNGRTHAGPLYVISQSQLTGLAFVRRGADKGNSVTISATAEGEPPTMNELEKLAASLGIDLDHATDAQKAQLQSIVDLQAGKGAPGDPPTATGKGKKKDRVDYKAAVQAELAETERQEEIKRISLAAMKEHPTHITQIDNLTELALENATDPEKFELELLRNFRTQKGREFSTRMAGPQDPTVIEAALAMSAGLPDVEKHYKPEVLETVDKVGLRNFSLQGLLMQVAHANGYTCRVGERIHEGNLKTVLEYCFPPVHVAHLSGFSTVNLPGILGNVANKEILAGYMEEDQTWMEIASVKNVSTLHTHTAYRMLDSLEFEQLGPGGQIKHGTLDQETFTRKANTYAKMLGITREQIINDDLGAFDDVRERLGRGGAKKFNNIFWAAFMNNASFFTTARTNYIEGATTNLGADGVGLELGVKAYRKMLSPSTDGSKRMGVAAGRPSILLVPPELEFVARRLFVSSNVQSGVTSNSFPDANIHQNLYRPVIQDRLSDSAFTGNSATAWYLLGSNLKAMVVSFLNGQRTPTVQGTEADFNQLGVQFRSFWDFGCDQAEYLSGVKSKGAA